MPPPTLQEIHKYLKAMDLPNSLPPGDTNWPGNQGKPWFDALYNDGLLELWKAVSRLERMAYFGENWPDVGGPVLVDKPGGPPPTKRPPPPPPTYPP